ncbi:MAG: glycosyltransferase family 4 protein [Desulfobulbaceae bacterium]|nr:glycosyltransferase family 4 protein [Desulfobulbaceae bacterium]
MKIMFVSAAYPPHYTGIGAYTRNMARALTGSGQQVLVATSRVDGQPDYQETEDGKIFRCYSWKELRTASLAERLLKMAADHRVDLIECADFLGEGGKLLRLPRNIPVCIKSHNSGPVRIGREAEVLYIWQRWMQWAAILRTWDQYREEKFSIEHGDVLATPSRRLMNELESQGFRLPVQRFVQPNPIALPEKDPGNHEDAQPSILFVGRLAIGKGIGCLPELVARLVVLFPAMKLVIAGDDSYARGLGSLRRWLMKRLGTLTDHVEFTGRLGREALMDRFDRAWLVIVPSLWDTFPTVVLEAMSRAKPVVASVHGGMAEMLENTLCKTALPGSEQFLQEVVTLLSDRALRQAAGRSMLTKARISYAPEIVARQYLEQIRDSISRGR